MNTFIESYAKVSGSALPEYIEKYNLIDWVKISAIMDAAMYFISPDCNKSTAHLRSYMYSKFLWFKNK